MKTARESGKSIKDKTEVISDHEPRSQCLTLTTIVIGLLRTTGFTYLICQGLGCDTSLIHLHYGHSCGFPTRGVNMPSVLTQIRYN